MATQKQRKAPRASFVVTVAASAALAIAALPGCGSTVSGSCPEAQPSYGSDCSGDGQSCSYGSDGCGNATEYVCHNGAWEYGEMIGTCNPPPPDLCPADLPAYGAPCGEVGAICDYPGGACDIGMTATCGDDLTWSVYDAGSCNPPPPPSCPAELPEQGAPCDPTWEEYCSYPVDTGCGPIDAQAQCVDGTWQVAIPTCNPPPPDYCYSLTSEADCAANASFCRWLVPGCADPSSPPPALAQASCHPSYDCVSSDECPVGTTCSEVVTDPCYNQGCDACGLVSNLCVAP